MIMGGAIYVHKTAIDTLMEEQIEMISKVEGKLQEAKERSKMYERILPSSEK